VKHSLCLLASLEMLYSKDTIQELVAAARLQYPHEQERLVVELRMPPARKILVQPLRHYLHLFDGDSENDIVDSLASRRDPQKSSLFTVIAIYDRYESYQILFSSCTALDMEMRLGRTS
jgi:hypothetical protein